MSKYDVEVKERWSDTDAYKEYIDKTAGYTADNWQMANDGLNDIFAKFAACMQEGSATHSPQAQFLVRELQTRITAHYYTCTNEILAGLGHMYIADDRFQKNIDSNAPDTAQYVSEAINIYCKK